MSWQRINNKIGQLRGNLYIGDNDKKPINNKIGQYLGYYLESQDKTYGKNGQLIGNGDQRMTLLED